MLFRKELPHTKTPANLPATELPSVTALLVLIGLQVTLNSDIDNLFSDDVIMINHMINFAANEMGTIPGLEQWKFFIRMGAPAQIQHLENSISKGFHTHKYARKFMIKHKIEDGIEQHGIEQVVFLSGGYDPRSYLAALKYPNVHFYELDRGKTRELKIAGLKAAPFGGDFVPVVHEETDYIRFGDNLHLVQCDFLLDNLQERLRAHGFSSAKRTLVIAEGLTMYLSDHDNNLLIENVFGLLQDNDEFLVGFRTSDKNPSAMGDKILASSKEPFKFVSDPKNMSAFAIKHGFDTTGKMLSEDLMNWALQPSKECRSDSYVLLRRDAKLKGQQSTVDIDTLPLIETTQLTARKVYKI